METFEFVLLRFLRAAIVFSQRAPRLSLCSTARATFVLEDFLRSDTFQPTKRKYRAICRVNTVSTAVLIKMTFSKDLHNPFQCSSVTCLGHGARETQPICALGMTYTSGANPENRSHFSSLIYRLTSAQSLSTHTAWPVSFLVDCEQSR